MQPIINKEAYVRYSILESVDAGIVLSGAEAKSIKRGSVVLNNAYVAFEHGQMWLKNAHIAPYQQRNQPGYDPLRPRKLLLTRKEIDTFVGKTAASHLTIIPEKVYSKSGLIKVTLGLARGLKKHDKRERIKKRDVERELRRTLKEQLHE